MTTREAAALIGCHPRHVRWLIAAGKLSAKLVQRQNRLEYDVSITHARRVRDQYTGTTVGRPRGGYKE